MARLISVRQIWTFILGYGGALVAIVVGPATALQMLANHPNASVGFASLAILIGVGSLAPLIALIAWMYRRSDEYERHTMLLTLGVAFGLSLLAMATLDLLQRTDLLPGWTWAPRWWTVVLCWMIAAVGVHFVQRRDG